MPLEPWYVVAAVEGREGIYTVEEVSAHSILAELAKQSVFLVSPWRDVAIDVAAKLNGTPPDGLTVDPVAEIRPGGGEPSCA